MSAVLCSRNEHKARELERLLPGWTVTTLDAADYPPEDGATYYDNARAKALYGREVGPRDAWMIGEDSGVEAAALDGAPGVHSARTAAGDEVGWMLRALAGIDERRARYVSELVAISPDGEELRGTGTLEGRIASAASGSEGFGFDPVFIPDGETQTVADLGDAWKAQHSHRANAARDLLGAWRRVM